MDNYDEILNNVSPDDLKKILSDLEATSLKNESFDSVKDKVETLVRCGFMVVTFPVGKYIYRGRVWDIEKPVYKVKSEISYPPVFDDTTLVLNRASSNKFQVFYGAIPTPDLDQAHLVAMTEVTNIFDQDFYEEYEYVVIGQWFVKKEFTIATLALHSEIAKVNRQAQEMLTFHSGICKQLQERGDLIESVARFLSKEFTKKVSKGSEHEYMISAAYGDTLMELGIPGVMFPSVKGDGMTFNIALHKEIVDDCIDLNLAAISRSQKIRDDVFIDWYLQSTFIDREGKLKWEEPPSESVIGAYERKEILKNMLKNKGKFVNPKDL